MPVKLYDPSAALEIIYLYEDFPGLAYNDRIWSVRGGSGSLTIPASCIGGQAQVRANANNYYEMYISLLSFTLARQFQQNWRVKLAQLTNCVSSFGLCGATSPAEALAFRYSSAVGGNWLLVSTTGSSTTTIDTGIVADTNFHEFKAAGAAGIVTCFIDGVPVGNMTATLPTGSLSPFCRTTSSEAATKDTLVDWVEVYGNRI